MISEIQRTIPAGNPYHSASQGFTEVDSEHWTVALNAVKSTSSLLLWTNVYAAAGHNPQYAVLTISDSNGGSSSNGAWVSVWLNHWYMQDCHQLWQCLNPVEGNYTVTIRASVPVKSGTDYAAIGMWEFANLGAPSSSPVTNPSGPLTTGASYPEGVLAGSPSPGLTFTATATNGSRTLTNLGGTTGPTRRTPVASSSNPAFVITATGIPSNTTIESVNVAENTLLMSKAYTGTTGTITVTPVVTATILSPYVTPANVGDLIFVHGWGGEHLEYTGDVLTNVNLTTPPWTAAQTALIEPDAGGDPITPPWTSEVMGDWTGDGGFENPLNDAFAWQVAASLTPQVAHWTMFTTDGWFSTGISFAEKAQAQSGILSMLLAA